MKKYEWVLLFIILIFTGLLIYQILIKDMQNNRFSFCNLFLLIIVASNAFLHAILLWFFEYYNRGDRGDIPVRPKVAALIAINKIATMVKLKVEISPCLIASIFWKKIITITITVIKSAIATTKRIAFFISSNKPIFDTPLMESKYFLKHLWGCKK